jgi:hypothetical protein
MYFYTLPYLIEWGKIAASDIKRGTFLASDRFNASDDYALIKGIHPKKRSHSVLADFPMLKRNGNSNLRPCEKHSREIFCKPM